MSQLKLAPPLQPRGGGIAGLFLGLTYPLWALRVLQAHPPLRAYVVGPVIINVLLGAGLYAGGLWWGRRAIAAAMTRLLNWAGPNWLDAGIQLLAPVIQGVLFVLLFLALGLVLLQFGSLLGSPFYGQLSEKLETLRVGQAPPAEPLSVGGIVRDLWRAVLFEVKKLVLLAIGGAMLLACNVVPGIGTLAASIGGIALAVVLLCLDMLDSPLERRRLKFRQKLSIVFRSFPASASFGLLCFGLVSIPLMNLLTIPLCVTAGTLFFCDRILPLPTDQA